MYVRVITYSSVCVCVHVYECVWVGGCVFVLLRTLECQYVYVDGCVGVTVFVFICV